MKEVIINIILVIFWLMFLAGFLVFMPLWIAIDCLGGLLTSKNKIGWFVKEIWNSRKILRFR